MRCYKYTLILIITFMFLLSAFLYSCSPNSNQLSPKITASTTITSVGRIAAITQGLPSNKRTDTVIKVPDSPEFTQTAHPATPTLIGFETTSQVTSVGLLGSPLISLTEMIDSTVFLVDLTTGYRRLLALKGAEATNVYGWEKDGCELIVGVRDGRIVKVDLKGNIVQVLYKVEDQENEVSFIYAISPTGELIASLVGYGYHDYASYEFQDLEVIVIEGQKKIRLTKEGGVRGFSWSPDGLLLAYSNKDSNGIPQLYISEPEGAGRLQLTQFTDTDAKIISPSWSPDGSKIAFQLESPNKGGALFIIYLNENLKMKRYDLSGGSIWWPDLTVLGLNGYYKEPGSSVYIDGIKWIDIDTGKIRHFVPESKLPGNQIYTKPFGNTSRIGFFDDKSIFFIYDVKMQKIILQQTFVGDLLIKDWNPAPMTFPGEANCAP